MSDFYKISDKFLELEEICQKCEEELILYITNGRTEIQGVKFRKETIKIDKKVDDIKRLIKKHKQDLRSDYS